LTRNECWTPFGAGEFRVFVDGEPVWRRAPPPRAAQILAPEAGDLALSPVL
jgi:hypothetical protein